MRYAVPPVLMAVVSAAVFLAACTSTGSAAGPPPATTRPAGVAVVEMFTSEGCSSCPPADELLAAIGEQARRDGSPVYPLAFHVDYWDRLGWRDRFASPAYSDRQRAYAAAAKADSVYTPQMVVNGRAAGFIGSDRAVAAREVAAAVARPAPMTVRLEPAVASGGRVRVGYAVDGGEVVGNVLNVAVAEQGLRSDVKRGENGGRTLRHADVVRTFHEVVLRESTGSVDLDLPADVKHANARIVAFVQDVRSLQVRGATAVALPSNP